MRSLVMLILLSASAQLWAGLQINPAPGPYKLVPYYEVSAFAMGGIDVSNPTSLGLVLTGISITALGNGDDSTAYAEIRLVIDANANGTYEPGVDVAFGASHAAYPVDNGTL